MLAPAVGKVILDVLSKLVTKCETCSVLLQKRFFPSNGYLILQKALAVAHRCPLQCN